MPCGSCCQLMKCSRRLDLQRVADQPGSRMRRRAQADDLRSEHDGAVIGIGRAMMERCDDRQGEAWLRLSLATLSAHPWVASPMRSHLASQVLRSYPNPPPEGHAAASSRPSGRKPRCRAGPSDPSRTRCGGRPRRRRRSAGADRALPRQRSRGPRRRVGLCDRGNEARRRAEFLHRSASQRKSIAPAREWRSRKPCASFVILAKPPATVTLPTGWERIYFSMPPTKSPMSIKAVSSSPWSRATALSETAPVAPATWCRPAARATSMPRWIEWIHAEQE